MVEIFDIENGKVVITPITLLVPELKAIHDNYAQPIQVLAYIAFMRSISKKNPYRDVPEEDREAMLLRDFPGDYKPTDHLIAEAFNKIDALEPSVIRFFRSVKGLVDKLSVYCDSVLLDDSKDGNLTNVLRIVKEAKTTIITFSQAEEEVAAQLQLGPANKKQVAYDLR